MGRSSSHKPAAPGPTRRGFFKRTGSAAALVAGSAALPLQTVQAGTGHQPFQHGVASGDPLADGVILWTRVTPEHVGKEKLDGKWVVATDPELTQVVLKGSCRAPASRDYTVKLDVRGLQPGTTYYYRFQFGQKLSPVGRTRTLPQGSVDHLRMAVVSCSNFAAGYFNVYRCLAQQADLDLVIHLGDYLYEYGNDEFGDTRRCEPANEILTLADYRMRHGQYKRDEDAQAMHRQHPLLAIWDDHETANNAWKKGAENHQPETEGAWKDRVQAALQAYYEWMPVRQQDKNHPRQNQRQVPLGNLVDLFMLEERLSARSEQLSGAELNALGKSNFSQTGAFTDPTRTLLGDAQERWLIDGLRASGARWRLLGQGVMFAQLKIKGAPNSEGGGTYLNPDQWDGYAPSRDRLFAAFQGRDGGAAIGNVVVLTGDIHSAWAADLTPDPNNADTANGGYNPRSGEGSVAVEFVATSVTSAGIPDPNGTLKQIAMSQNPHFKHVDLMNHGYLLLDVTAQRLVSEFWNVATVATPDATQALAAAWQVRSGSARLREAQGTAPRAVAPALAP